MTSSRAVVPASLTSDCAPIGELSNADNLVGYTADLIIDYQECAAKHRALSGAVKQ